MRRILYQEEGLGTELRVAFSLERLLETKFVIQIHEWDRHRQKSQRIQEQIRVPCWLLFLDLLYK